MLEGCTYNCNDNYKVLNPATGKLQPCPYCTPRLQENIERGILPQDGEDLLSSYNIRRTTYVWDDVVPETSWSHLDSDKVEDVKNAIHALLGVLEDVNGQLDRSYFFGLTEKGKPENLIGPLVVTALRSGKSVAKIMSASEYNAMLLSDNPDGLNDMLTPDVVIMLIDSGCTKASLLAVKGLLEQRALKYKGTVLVTTWSMTAVSRVLSWHDDITFSQCEPHFISYVGVNTDNKSWYTRGITGYSASEDDDAFNSDDVDSGYSFEDGDYVS